MVWMPIRPHRRPAGLRRANAEPETSCYSSSLVGNRTPPTCFRSPTRISARTPEIPLCADLGARTRFVASSAPRAMAETPYPREARVWLGMGRCPPDTETRTGMSLRSVDVGGTSVLRA
jgi:hypothetical protein